jgi:hypothetical protein
MSEHWAKRLIWRQWRHLKKITLFYASHWACFPTFGDVFQQLVRPEIWYTNSTDPWPLILVIWAISLSETFSPAEYLDFNVFHFCVFTNRRAHWKKQTVLISILLQWLEQTQARVRNPSGAHDPGFNSARCNTGVLISWLQVRASASFCVIVMYNVLKRAVASWVPDISEVGNSGNELDWSFVTNPPFERYRSIEQKVHSEDFIGT